MKLSLPDIDIDVLDRTEALAGIARDRPRASMLINGELKKHPTGVFFQNMPVDPTTKFAAFPSGKKSGSLDEAFGFVKIDLIPNSALSGVRDPAHMDEILLRRVDWSAFEREEIVTQLHHINNYFEIVGAYQPQSIEDLAALIALIRPAKQYLIGEQWPVLHKSIWKKEAGDAYFFKKSHAIAFALLIVVQLQVMLEAETW